MPVSIVYIYVCVCSVLVVPTKVYKATRPMHFDRISCHKHGGGIYCIEQPLFPSRMACASHDERRPFRPSSIRHKSQRPPHRIRYPILATHFRPFFFYILFFSYMIITWYYLGQLTTDQRGQPVGGGDTKLIIGSDMKKARQQETTTTTTRSNS